MYCGYHNGTHKTPPPLTPPTPAPLPTHLSLLPLTLSALLASCDRVLIQATRTSVLGSTLRRGTSRLSRPSVSSSSAPGAQRSVEDTARALCRYGTCSLWYTPHLVGINRDVPDIRCFSRYPVSGQIVRLSGQIVRLSGRISDTLFVLLILKYCYYCILILFI